MFRLKVLPRRKIIQHSTKNSSQPTGTGYSGKKKTSMPQETVVKNKKGEWLPPIYSYIRPCLPSIF